MPEVSGCILNYSFESLIDLWLWFINVSQIEKMTEQRKENIRNIKRYDENTLAYIIECEDKGFSVESEYILRDIAMYVGQVFVDNNLNICWGYHTEAKRDSFCNMPILKGFVDKQFTPPFEMIFEPNHMVHVQAENILDKSEKETDLFDMCICCRKYV